MLSKARIYKNTQMLSAVPSLMTNTQSIMRTVPDNTKLRKLFLNQIPDTKMNREISFWSEPVVISFAYITAYTILGTGLKINCSNSRAKDVITEFNNQINASMQNYYDLYCDSYIDNIIHGGSYWRVFYTKDSPIGIDVARIDPTTFVKKRDKRTGYEVLIQKARVHKTRFRERSSFYNYWKKNAMNTNSLSEIQEDYNIGRDEEYQLIVIPNEPDYMLQYKFFKRPPVSSILNHAEYKRWILWYMKEYAKRYWSPFRVGYVGDPQYYMPDDSTEFKKERDNLLQALMQMDNFGALATPGYNKIEETSKNTARSSAIYVDFANFLNEEMMFSMMGSMGIRSARGTELATGRVLEQGFLRYGQGIRGRYDIKNKYFYVKNLLPANSIKIAWNELEFQYSPMVVETIDTVMKAVKDGCDCMIFEDWNEPRKILQSVFGSVMDELDDAAASKLQEKFMELNKKPEPFGGNQDAKPAAKTAK